MHWTGWIVTALAVALGEWLAVDGARAFAVGDYVTPRTGPHAGQLGPWSKIVAAVGLDPRSATIKGAHVALGVCWLVAAGLFIVRRSAGWSALVACSAASLWYAPLGTVIAIIELSLLTLPALRARGVP